MSMRGFCSPQEVYGEQLVFFLEKVFMCAPFSPFMGRFVDHSHLSMSNFRAYEHFSVCFIPKDLSLGFSELF
jgi:hypothetical protein